MEQCGVGMGALALPALERLPQDARRLIYRDNAHAVLAAAGAARAR